MKYLSLVYPPAGFSRTPAVIREFLSLRRTMTEAGVFLGSGQLQPVDSATTVRVHGGETVLTDGPFAEIKEHVGGYILLECADLDEAVRWTAMFPGVQEGAAEIRPLMELAV
ncbi:MAG TPA: YciI family protein [Candidatus Dormibacteraeota bacterium]